MSKVKPCPYDHDCFHCPEEDCICSDGSTKWESNIMHGAHEGWDLEIRVKRIVYMMRSGVGYDDMIDALNVTPTQFSHARKKAALLLRQEKRKS